MTVLDKKQTRLRRARKTRGRIAAQKKARLCIHKTAKHMYAYLIDSDGSKTFGTAATTQKTLCEGLAYTGNVGAAEKVGEAIAQIAKEKGISEVAFDRSGFKYHGRVKALAEAARKGGLKF